MIPAGTVAVLPLDVKPGDLVLAWAYEDAADAEVFPVNWKICAQPPSGAWFGAPGVWVEENVGTKRSVWHPMQPRAHEIIMYVARVDLKKYPHRCPKCGSAAWVSQLTYHYPDDREPCAAPTVVRSP